MSLAVLWDGAQIGVLETSGERSRAYTFRYVDTARAISLSLPATGTEPFSEAETRPFFEALLPEGVVREQIADQLRIAASDSYGLLAALGRDCAGALQIVGEQDMSGQPSARWLEPAELDRLIADLPNRPLGLDPADERVRLSLAGVQRKAVLVRDSDGRFGEPLHGMPSTHILKPDAGDERYPAIAVNEFFCMRLATTCGLDVASVELITLAGRPCLVVERFDRDLADHPARRLHQEDLCQALGITPDFKYQKAGWRLPSYAALADLLDEYGRQPGLDRLAVARAALFNFAVGNADAHAKNISLLHRDDGIRLAPAYDLVCTAAYPHLSTELSLAVGDELDAKAVGPGHWSDLGFDLGLQPRAFERERARLASEIVAGASALREAALAQGWHDPVVDRIVATVTQRAPRLG